MYILSNREPQGTDFKILGVELDIFWTMQTNVDAFVTKSSWEFKMLLRTRRFYTDAEMNLLYKSCFVSFLVYRTPAIYHATRDILRRMDRAQGKFLEEAGASEEDSLMTFILA